MRKTCADTHGQVCNLARKMVTHVQLGEEDPGRTLEGDVVTGKAVRVGGVREVFLSCSLSRKLYLGAGYPPLIGHSGDQCGPGVLFQ